MQLSATLNTRYSGESGINGANGFHFIKKTLSVNLLLTVLLIICHPQESDAFEKSAPDSIKTSIVTYDTSLAGQKDVRDVIGKVLKLSVKPDSMKMKGNGPFFSLFPTIGYSLQSGLTGVLTTSTSFYSSEQRKKLSNILMNLYYSQYHQFWILANSNIFLDKPKLHLYGDWRYYKYPTHTYGIGSTSSASDKLEIDFSYIRFYQQLSKEIFRNGFAGVGYNLDYHWNFSASPPDGEVYNEIMDLQSGNKSVSSGLSANFLYDSRKNSINPAGGSFAAVQFRQNLKFLGSDNNWQSLNINLKTYVKLPAKSRNVLAFWSYNEFTLNGEAPYFDLPSNGWDDYSNTGRGYVQGRYTGRNFVYAETEYRAVLSRNGLFGCVAFFNAETFFDKYSESSKKIIPGGGLGIRIKINKNSSSNLSIDYGFGLEGSRGFFFNLGEVF